MKLNAGFSAGIASFLGKVEQKIKHYASKKANFRRILLLAVLVALFCGFFCLIFVSSWDSLKSAENSEILAISEFSASAGKFFAKEVVAKTKISESVCEAAIPLASMVNPVVTLLKEEELCKMFALEEQTPSSNEVEQTKEKTFEELEKEEFKKQLLEILEGTPMQEMIDPIAEQPRIVAAYLVGIALKESSFGEHSPSKSGVNCYNYWGYKGATNPTPGGYSCFASPNEAVEVVGARLEKLAIEQKRDTPAKMIIWKCGSSCETHSPESVAKWISDVSKYFFKLNKFSQS